MSSGFAGMGVLMPLIYVLGDEAETAIPIPIGPPTNNRAVGLPYPNVGHTNSSGSEVTVMGNGGTRGEWKMDRISRTAYQPVAQPGDRIGKTSPAAGLVGRFESR